MRRVTFLVFLALLLPRMLVAVEGPKGTGEGSVGPTTATSSPAPIRTWLAREEAIASAIREGSDGSAAQDTLVVKPPATRRNPWRRTGLLLFGASWVLTPVADYIIDSDHNFPSLWVPVAGPMLAWGDIAKSGVECTEWKMVNVGILTRECGPGEPPNWGYFKVGLIASTIAQTAGLVMFVAGRTHKPEGRVTTSISVVPQRRGFYFGVRRVVK